MGTGRRSVCPPPSYLIFLKKASTPLHRKVGGRRHPPLSKHGRPEERASHTSPARGNAPWVSQGRPESDRPRKGGSRCFSVGLGQHLMEAKKIELATSSVRSQEDLRRILTGQEGRKKSQGGMREGAKKRKERCSHLESNQGYQSHNLVYCHCTM